jgi:hypothetical protein
VRERLADRNGLDGAHETDRERGLRQGAERGHVEARHARPRERARERLDVAHEVHTVRRAVFGEAQQPREHGHDDHGGEGRGHASPDAGLKTLQDAHRTNVPAASATVGEWMWCSERESRMKSKSAHLVGTQPQSVRHDLAARDAEEAGSWLTTMYTPAPAVKPTSTDSLTKRVIVPTRSRPAMVCTTPMISVSRMTACTGSPCVAKSAALPAIMTAMALVGPVDEVLGAAERRAQDGRCDGRGEAGRGREARDERVGHALGDGEERRREPGDEVVAEVAALIPTQRGQQREDALRARQRGWRRSVPDAAGEARWRGSCGGPACAEDP